jgi:DNA-binding transcriptional regulator/RsmH inhibitor MraZ
VEDAAQETNSAEPPRGAYTGRFDDKGRLRLPADMVSYFNSLPEKDLFVTSLDGRIAQIYLMSIWRENEKFFETYREKPKVAQQVGFLASALGAGAVMDSQGRIQFPAKLRKQLGLENENVHLYSYKGRIQVVGESIYQEKLGVALAAAEDNAFEMEQAGLK